MNILVYYEQVGYGGVDTHLAYLINNWPDENDNFIIVSNPDNQGLPYLKQKIYSAHINIHTIDGVFKRSGEGSPIITRIFSQLSIQLRFVINFKKLLIKLSPDVVLSNNGGYPGGLTNWTAAILSRKQFKISTFVLVHHAPVAKLNSFSSIISGLLAQWVVSLDIPLITVSHASKIMLEKFTPLKKMVVIHNGLELNRKKTIPFDFNKKLNISHDRVIIGILGPVDEHKGHLTILEVFRRSSYLRKKAFFVVVGSGNKKFIDNLIEKVDEYDIKHVASFLGFMPFNSYNIVSGFDVLVMPTIDFEGFGYSMAEAMSEGIPVIASKVGAIPEVIVDGESGILVEALDVLGWQDFLENLVRNDLLRRKIGRNGRERIINKFAASSMSNNYYNLIKKK